MKYKHKRKILYSWVTFVIIIGGISISILIYFNLVEEEKDHINSVFIREMDNRYASLDRELNLHSEFLLGLKGLFDSSEHVTREDFNRYVAPVLARIGGIQAVEWVPRVSNADVHIFEAEARNNGLPGFLLTQMTKQRRLEPVGYREVYYPVFYIVPVEGNEAAIGYDLGSNQIRLETLNQARDTGTIIVTPMIILVQEKESQSSMLQIVPVFSGNPETLDERRKSLRGFVVGVHRIGDIVDYSLSTISVEKSEISFCILDASASGEKRRLFKNDSWSDGPRSNDFYYERRLSFGNRKWIYIGVPTEKFIRMNSSLKPLGAFVSGMAITFLLALYLRKRLRELKELRSFNKIIVDVSLHCIIMIDSNGIILLFNRAAEKVFGYSSEEGLGQNVKILMPEP